MTMMRREFALSSSGTSKWSEEVIEIGLEAPEFVAMAEILPHLLEYQRMSRTPTSSTTVGFLFFVTGVFTAVTVGTDLLGMDGNEKQKNDWEMPASVVMPDESAILDLGNVSEKEIQNRLVQLQQNRLATLRLMIVVTRAEYDAGIAGTTLDDLIQANAKLSQAELEYSKTSADRIAALQKLLAGAIQLELEVRAKADVGAMGGSQRNLHQAVDARLRAEEQLAREYLAQRIHARLAPKRW